MRSYLYYWVGAMDHCDTSSCTDKRQEYWRQEYESVDCEISTLDARIRALEEYTRWRLDLEDGNCGLATYWENELAELTAAQYEAFVATVPRDPYYDWAALGSYSYRSYDTGFTDYCTIDQAHYDEKKTTFLANTANFYSESAINDFNTCSGAIVINLDPATITKPTGTYDYLWTSYSTAELNRYLSAWKSGLTSAFSSIKTGVATQINFEATVAAINIKAREIVQATAGDPDLRASIIECERQLVQYLIDQQELYYSYWDSADFSPSCASSSDAFLTTDITSGSQRDVRNLQLNQPEPVATDQRSDFIVLPDLMPIDGGGPLSITTCESNGLFTGVQVFFGHYKQVAGASHGDLSTTCTNTRIRDPIVLIETYSSNSGTDLVEGMVITMNDMTDVAYPGQQISVGRVNQDGQQRRRLEFPSGTNRDTSLNFWGFQSTTDASFKITQLSIISYTPETLYRYLGCSYFSNLDNGISNGITQRSQTSIYGLSVIQNKQLGNLEEPTDFACINCKDRDGSGRKTRTAVAFLIIGCIFLTMAACSLMAMCMMKKRMGSMA